MKLFFKFLILGVILASCSSDDDDNDIEPNVWDGITITEFVAENYPGEEPDENGLYVIVTREGSGDKAEEGDQLSVFYSGELLDGTVFDSSHKRPEKDEDEEEEKEVNIFKFTLGKGEVIEGWDIGFDGLNYGTKAIFIIPAELGYGDTPRGSIPGGAPLLFEVELLNLR
ncbi:FKBP-type peptidyl-prolyl cis-trans isomerase [Marinilabiliaceae bacterium ANBcel2]|nr:FKBP-type peptidyl-prolyl cis-trans isomerase [Marinilabiliaceae bacterium ANBcel2]